MSRRALRSFTQARVEVECTGHSVKTADALALRLAQALARDAVHDRLNSRAIAGRLNPQLGDCISVRSAVPDRATYLRRPDLGRRLTEESCASLQSRRGAYDVVFVIADGLSALAVEKHAVQMLNELIPALLAPDWAVAPIVIAEQARVAIGDEIGYELGANQSVVFIGERPGMSSPDSLGAYLTWSPRLGLKDANRNCVSNIRDCGLSYQEAGHKILFLLREARRRRLSGVLLKEDAGQLPAAASPLERNSLPAFPVECEGILEGDQLKSELPSSKQEIQK